MTKKNNWKKRNTVNNGLASALGLDFYSSATNPFELYSNASPFILSNQWVELVNLYKNNGFIKLAVDLPVADCFRNGGYELESATLDGEELQELNETLHTKDDEIIKQVMRWARLFGGGSIVCNTEQQPDTPFNPETIQGKDVEFLACDRWQCYPLDSRLRLAQTFALVDVEQGEKGEFQIYDKSRIKSFVGEVQPYYLRNQAQGWGLSIIEAIIPQLSQYLKANSVILELLDEAKIDVLKIFGLADILLSENGESAVKRRVDIFAKEKNYKNVGVMDTQDDYIQKVMSFGGLNQLLEKIFLLICSSLRIPYSKVFGRGASGFSSGEDDLENYNAMIMSEMRNPAEELIKWVAQIRACQLFGRKIDDLTIKWKPLRVMSEAEEQQIKSQKIASYVQLLQMGIITRKKLAEQLQKDEIIAFSEEELTELENDDSPIPDEETETEEVINNSFTDKVKNFFKR